MKNKKSMKFIFGKDINYLFTYKFDLSLGVELKEVEVSAFSKTGIMVLAGAKSNSLLTLAKQVPSDILKDAAYWSNFYREQLLVSQEVSANV